MPTPMTLVLFGATGDLARCKLWPALHDLAASDRLPDELSVLGVSRSASTEELRELAAEHGPAGARLRVDRALGAAARRRPRSSTAPPTTPSSTSASRQALDGREGDRLTYLSVAPSLFAEIAGRLAGIGLGREAGAASRLVIEKPFGEDLASARELRAALHEHFDEEQLLRIDHYLGKEAAQNLLVLRFVNGIFEPLWDRRSIESIQVTVAEDGGVGGRGDFYDAHRRAARRRPEPPAAAARAHADGRARARGRRRAARRAPEGPALAAARSSPATPCSASTRATATRRASRTARAPTPTPRCASRSPRGAGPACPATCAPASGWPPKAAEIAVAFRPSPHMPFEGAEGWAGANRLIIGIQPGEKVAAARHGQAARRRARARQGRARLRRGRGRRARRARGLRAPARRRDRRRHDAGSPPATRSRRSGPRSSRCCATGPSPCPTRPGPPGPSRRATSRAATAGGGARLSSTAARSRPLAGLRRPAVLVPLLVTLAAAAWMHAAPADQLARTLPTEDAYYALSAARHVALGDGITADGVHDTNGFQPLWVALNVPLYVLAGGDRIAGLRLSQVLSTLLWLAFVVLIALQARALARRHGAEGSVAAAAAALVAAGCVGIFRLFHNGLETGTVLVALAAAVLVLDRWEDAGRRAGCCCAGLAPRARSRGRGSTRSCSSRRSGPSPCVRARGRLARSRSRRWPRARSPRCVLSPVAGVERERSTARRCPAAARRSPPASTSPATSTRRCAPAGAWSAPPLLRPSMHADAIPATELLCAVAVLLALGAAWRVRRRRTAPLGQGTVALIAFCALPARLVRAQLRPVLVHGALPGAAAAAHGAVPGHARSSSPARARARSRVAGGGRARRQRAGPRRAGGRPGLAAAGVGGARLQPRRAPEPQPPRPVRVGPRPRGAGLRRRRLRGGHARLLPRPRRQPRRQGRPRRARGARGRPLARLRGRARAST